MQDNDAGTNGLVDFSLVCKTGGYQHLFSISERGEIRANEMLDREVNPQVLLFTVSTHTLLSLIDGEGACFR